MHERVYDDGLGLDLAVNIKNLLDSVVDYLVLGFLVPFLNAAENDERFVDPHGTLLFQLLGGLYGLLLGLVLYKICMHPSSIFMSTPPPRERGEPNLHWGKSTPPAALQRLLYHG